jgi:hypothetical protein
MATARAHLGSAGRASAATRAAVKQEKGELAEPKGLLVPATGRSVGLPGSGPAAAPGRGERRGWDRVAAGGPWAAARARSPASGDRGAVGSVPVVAWSPWSPRSRRTSVGSLWSPHRRAAAGFARGGSEREGPAGVCSSFYEGPVVADDPVARRRSQPRSPPSTCCVAGAPARQPQQGSLPAFRG